MKSALYLFSSLALWYGLNRIPIIPEDELSLHHLAVPEHLRVSEGMPVVFPINTVEPILVTRVFPPFVGSSVVGFKEALAFKESRGNYFMVNTLGYLGKYQFGLSTLQTVGIYNPSRFLESPELQETVFYTTLSRNKWILRRDIDRFAGKRINGITITESGILAAAHLAGPGNVKKYLRSVGRTNPMDAYGTKLSDYLEKFSGFDLSEIPALKNPRI